MTVDIATLGLEVRSDGVVVASDRLRGLQREGRQTEQGTRRLSRGFDELSGRARMLTRALGALGVAFSLRGLQQQISQTVEWAATLADTADNLGLNTTQLQRYRAAARDSTVSVSALDRSMERFNRRLGEAAQGSGELNDVAEQLGLVGLSTAEAFEVVADAVAHADSSQEAARIGYAAFGRQIDEIAPMLRRGAAGIRELGDEAERGGRVIDEALVRRGADAAASLNRINDTIQLSMRAGLLSGFVDSMSDIEEVVTSPEFQSGLRFVGQTMGVIASSAAEATRQLGALIEILTSPSWDSALDVGVLGLARRTGEAFGLWGDRGGARGDEDAPDGQPLPSMRLHPISVEDEDPAFDLDRVGRERLRYLDRQIGFQEELNQATRMGEEAQRDVMRQHERIRAVLEFRRDLESEILANAEDRDQLTRGELEHVQRVTDQYQEQFSVLQDLESEFERITDAQRRAEQAGRDLGFTFESAFENAILRGEAFRDVLDGILQDIARIALRATITRDAGDALGGFFGDMFGGANAQGNAFSGGDVVPFARGGVVGGPSLFGMSGGRTGLMGEAGPEAIMPLSRGPGGRLGVEAQVSPVAVGVNVNVQNYGNDSVEVTQGVNDQGIEELFITIAARDVETGGKLGKAINRVTGTTRRGVQR